MTFKNLQFVDHPVGGGIMAQIMLNNGKRLSVIAGAGFYSYPSAALYNSDEFTSFEVMVGKSDPLGWQSREDIDKIMLQNA